MWGKLPSTAMTSSYFSSTKQRSMLRLSESLRLTRSCSVRTLYWGRRRSTNAYDLHTAHPKHPRTSRGGVGGYLLGETVAEVLLLKVGQLQQRRLGLLQALHDHLRQLHAVLNGDQPRGGKTCDACEKTATRVKSGDSKKEKEEEKKKRGEPRRLGSPPRLLAIMMSWQPTLIISCRRAGLFLTTNLWSGGQRQETCTPVTGWFALKRDMATDVAASR